MTLAEAAVAKCDATAYGPDSDLKLARIAVMLALERAAQECDMQCAIAKNNGWFDEQRMAHNLAVIIRALKGQQ